MSVVAPYQRPSRLRSIWQIVNSIVPYFSLMVVMYFTLAISYWITLALSIVTAGFLIRVFIVFHDCCHGSFFSSRKANYIWGTLTGILTFTPYSIWRRAHLLHHDTSGNLDQRGEGDVWTMTVNEYLAASRGRRFGYRFFRNPFVLLVLGPLYILLIKNRIWLPGATRGDRLSVVIGDVAIAAMFVAAWFTIGIKSFIAIQLPVYWIGSLAGIWLFYVQHQFDGVYWERQDDWNPVSASLDGSSFYKLPRIIQWFTGNIGYHHLHHLSSQIPSYYLPRCHRDLVKLHPINAMTFIPSLKALGYRLWDEDGHRLVGFGSLHERQSPTRA